MSHTDYFSDYESVITDTDSYLSGGYSLDLTSLSSSDTYPSLTIPTFDFDADFTVECFVKTSVNTGISPVFSTYDPVTTSSWLYAEQARFTIGRTELDTPPAVALTASGGNTIGPFNTADEVGEWIHVALQYDSGNSKVYLGRNGYFKEFDFALGVPTGTKMEVGRATDSTSTRLNGLVSNMRISDTVLYPAAYTVPDPTDWSSSDANVIMYADFVPPPAIDVSPSSLFAKISWNSGGENYHYRLDLTDESGVTSNVISGTQELETISSNLDPQSAYTATLYSSADDDTYTLVTTEAFTTLENSAANFDNTVFDDGTGTFDMSGVEGTTWDLMDEVLNDVYTTGDCVRVKTEDGTTEDTKFVNLSDNIDVERDVSLMIPFSASNGVGQETTLNLSDSTTTGVTYDETTGSVTVNGVAYSKGDTFILDGQKISISEV